MKLLDNSTYAVERAVLNDVIKFENGRMVVHDDKCAVVRVGNWHKCVFADITDFNGYADKYGLYGNVCFLGASETADKALGFESSPCVTFAYLGAMPPQTELPRGVEIKRLAPSLAQTVVDAYHNPGGGYTVEHMAKVMREKGVFGAIADGKLAGFIGRHGDGSMGMLEVFDGFRKRGIGGALERFLINFVMTFGRTPFCDVYTDNAASMQMQKAVGLTPGCGYTFWTEIAGEGKQ